MSAFEVASPHRSVRLSTWLTFLFAATPIAALAGAVIHLIRRSPTVTVLLPTLALAASLGLLYLPLTWVRTRGNQLRVLGWWRSIAIPLDSVVEVEDSRFGRWPSAVRLVTIEFRSKDGTADEIQFLARLVGPQQPAIAQMLRELVAAHRNSTLL
jgi:hypothetical protein